MKAPLNPALDAIFNEVILVCILCGFCALFGSIYGSFCAKSVQRKLLQALEDTAPSVYKRLYKPIWRGNINPLDLATFLRSVELDDDPNIRQLKDQCRHSWRWIIGGLLGFLALLIIILFISYVAVSLGSTNIRFGEESLGPQQYNSATTRRCTRPPTAPFVVPPLSASGGG